MEGKVLEDCARSWEDLSLMTSAQNGWRSRNSWRCWSLPPSATMIAEWELMGRPRKSLPLAIRSLASASLLPSTLTMSSSLWQTLNSEVPEKEILESAAHALVGSVVV